MAQGDELPQTYDCVKCPSFCCTAYDYIEVTHNDMQLIANHFNITIEQAIEKYTVPSELSDSEQDRQLLRVPDKLLGTTCVFLNQQTRLCGIHLIRPDVCRDWNGRIEGDVRHCDYFNLYKFLEDEQGKHYLPLIQIERRKWKKSDRPSLKNL